MGEYSTLSTKSVLQQVTADLSMDIICHTADVAVLTFSN